jgi:hypothetical protein
MPMRGRAFGPQNRILSSERGGGHKVKALIRTFEGQKGIRGSEANYGQNVESFEQLYELLSIEGIAIGQQSRVPGSGIDGGQSVRALIHKYHSLAQNQSQKRNFQQRVSGLRQALSRRPLIGQALIEIFDRINLRQRCFGLQNSQSYQSTQLCANALRSTPSNPSNTQIDSSDRPHFY